MGLFVVVEIKLEALDFITWKPKANGQQSLANEILLVL